MLLIYSRRLFLLMTACLLLSACESTSYNKQSLQSVDRVAIVSLSGAIENPDEDQERNIFRTGAILKGVTKAYEGDAELSSYLYRLLSQKMHHELDWSVQELSDITNNPGYQQIYSDHHKSWIPSVFQLPDLLRFEAGRLNHQERQKLIEDLGVDAICLYSVDLDTHGQSRILGATAFTAYKAHVNLALYTKGEEKPVWKVHHMAGDVSDNKVTSYYGMTADSEVSAAVMSAVDSSLDKAFKQYQEESQGT